MNKITAGRLRTQPDPQGFPEASEWGNTQLLAFCADWRSENQDPQRETSVQVLWSPDRLFIRFRCRFREIYVYEGGNSRRDRLWMTDVAEVFIRPDADDPRNYKEFEISPNGDWLDLDIAPGAKTILMCDMATRVAVNHQSKTWSAELAIPFHCLAPAFDPGETWRVNFFRIEGREPERFYSAWRPTHTPRPNFHVPDAFGYLYFEH